MASRYPNPIASSIRPNSPDRLYAASVYYRVTTPVQWITPTTTAAKVMLSVISRNCKPPEETPRRYVRTLRTLGRRTRDMRLQSCPSPLKTISLLRR